MLPNVVGLRLDDGGYGVGFTVRDLEKFHVIILGKGTALLNGDLSTFTVFIPVCFQVKMSADEDLEDLRRADLGDDVEPAR